MPNSAMYLIDRQVEHEQSVKRLRRSGARSGGIPPEESPLRKLIVIFYRLSCSDL